MLISERYKGKEHPSSVTHLLNLASSYSRSKNFVEAERLLRTSLQIMSKTVAPEDQSFTAPMLHLAVTLYHLKRDEEAERLALEAVRIRENAFGKQSLPVGKLIFFVIFCNTFPNSARCSCEVFRMGGRNSSMVKLVQIQCIMVSYFIISPRILC